MTTKPTPLPEPNIVNKHYVREYYTATQMHAHAAAVNADLRAEIERHKTDWSRFHHVMAKHGLHPGRTDDDLIDILDRALADRDAEIDRLVKMLARVEPLVAGNLNHFEKLEAEIATLRAAAQQALEALQHAMTENFRHQLAQQKIYNAKELADAIAALTAALESK
jgi:hypothetical protein